MSPQAQRIAIAKACGWITNPDPKDHSGHRYYAPKGTSPFLGRHVLPDYLNDLNAMREAEKTLTYAQGGQMTVWIQHMTCAGYGPQLFATASQRAEAFLRTIGRWEEEGQL